MPALDEQVIESSDVNRADNISEYRAIVLRCENPKPGDPERCRELMASIGVSRDDFVAHCRLVDEFHKAEATAADDRPIKEAEKQLAHAEREARREASDTLAKLLPLVRPDALHSVLQAAIDGGPKDHNGFAAGEGREAQEVRDRIFNSVNGAKMGLDYVRAEQMKAGTKALQLKTENRWLAGQ